MIGITLTTDQIRNAPAQVRQWIEHEVISALGLATAIPAAAHTQAAHLVPCSEEEAASVFAQIQGVLPVANVFFELGRPGISFGQPPLMVYRLIDILHHTRLQNMEQVMACLGLINQALAQVRHDPSARFCSFDSQGHCFIAPETQQSIAALWQDFLASQRRTAGREALPMASSIES